MLCSQKGVSLREFAIEILIKAIEEYEDEMLAKKANARLEEIEKEETVDWKEACRLAGWENEEKI